MAVLQLIPARPAGRFEHDVIPFNQTDADAVVSQGFLDNSDDLSQQFVNVQDRRDVDPDLVHQAELLDSLLLRGKEVRVLHSHANLVTDRCKEFDFLIGELAVAKRGDKQRAHYLTFRAEGYAHQRMDPFLASRSPGQSLVRGDVSNHERVPRLSDTSRKTFTQSQAIDTPHKIRAKAPVRGNGQLLISLVQQIYAPRRNAHHAQRLIQGIVQNLFQFQRATHHGSDRVQRGQLLSPMGHLQCQFAAACLHTSDPQPVGDKDARHQ